MHVCLLSVLLIAELECPVHQDLNLLPCTALTQPSQLSCLNNLLGLGRASASQQYVVKPISLEIRLFGSVALLCLD